jgi:hypothetical protein
MGTSGGYSSSLFKVVCGISEFYRDGFSGSSTSFFVYMGLPMGLGL